MPNWCQNSLFVEGSEDDIAFFRSQWMNDYLQFEDFVPIPEDQKENWYDWCVKNWGTKWDIGEEQKLEEEFDTSLRIAFDTAWSPPLLWLEKVAAEYPSLYFALSYHEGGMCFAGYRNFKNGKQDMDIYEIWTSEKEYAKKYRLYAEAIKKAWWEPDIEYSASEAEAEEDNTSEEDTTVYE